MLDHLIHSYMDLEDPTALDYGYERAYADLTEAHANGRPPIDTLFIGGGGYAFPRYVEAKYSGASVDVIEIDPAVIEVAHQQLGLPPTSRIRSFNQDARMFLREWTEPKQYDVIYGDAFNDLSVPYHLTTVEFNRIVASRMKPDGIYLANVIDKLAGGEFLKAYANSLRAVFPHVYVFARGDSVAAVRPQHLRADGQPATARTRQARRDDVGGDARGEDHHDAGRSAQQLSDLRTGPDADRRLRAGRSVAGQPVHRAWSVGASAPARNSQDSRSNSTVWACMFGFAVRLARIQESA